MEHLYIEGGMEDYLNKDDKDAKQQGPRKKNLRA
jgi:hypothetical protein